MNKDLNEKCALLSLKETKATKINSYSSVGNTINFTFPFKIRTNVSDWPY